MTGPGALLAAMAGALLVGGILLTVNGFRRVPVDLSRPGSGPRRRIAPATRQVLLPGGLGLALGMFIGIATGWLIAIVLLPLAFVALPMLLRTTSSVQIERLEALEEWTRSLAGVLTAGVGLEQALVATLRSTPKPILEEVSALVGRLHARWPTEDALRAFADDLDDATGDLVAAKLVLASRRRGPGLASVLESLAESVAADVRTRRQIEADRDRPRATVRWVTLITMAALALLMFNKVYMAPYKTPIGQVLLGLFVVLDIVLLAWMKSMTKVARLPRFIGRAVERQTVERQTQVTASGSLDAASVVSAP